MTDEKRIEAVAQALCCGWECVEPDRCRCDSMEHDARMAIAALDDARDAEIARLQAKCRDAAKYLQWYHENSVKQHPTADSMISSLRNEKTRTALNGGDNERSR
jgi:hypothetical protein